MTKKLTTCILFSLFTSIIFAQPGSGWQWTSTSGTANQNPGNRAREVVTDNAGNVYVAGTFEGIMTVGAFTISTSGDATTGGYDEDVFVAKYDAAGAIQWLKKFGLAGPGNNQEVFAMDIDNSGNMYVGGSGGSGYSYHAFLVKFDANGNQGWAKTDFTLPEVNGIAVAPDGNPVIMEISQSAKNVFKINASTGNVVWQVGNTNAGDNAASVYRDFVDAAGNTYYCLFNISAASTTIADQPFTTTGLTSYIASLDNNGNTRWVQKIDNRQLQTNLFIDESGKSYLSLAGGAGATWQGIATTATFLGGYGYFELNNAGLITNYKTASPYGARFRIKADGIYGYNYIAGSTLQAIDAYGDLIVATPNGTSKGLGLVVKYDKNTAAVLWANTCEFTAASLDAGSVNSIDVSPAGKVVVAGSYSLTAKFGSNTFTATPTNSLFPKDFFISQFDPNTIAAPVVTNWTGLANNSNWNDAGNWDNGIPNGNRKTNILAGAANYPVAIPATVTPAKLEIGAGVTLQLPLALKSPLGIINNGTIILNEAGYFYSGFDGGNSAIIAGTGKVVMKNSGLSFAGGTKPFVNSLEIDAPGARIAALGGTITGSLFITNGMLIGSTASPLIIDDASATITNTAASYYTGLLKRKVNASGVYSFPIAEVTSYSPYAYTPVQTATITLNNVVGPRYISALFTKSINGAAPNTTAGGQPVTSLLNGGFWTITPDVALTGGSYNITLREGGFANDVPDASRYVVLKRNNSSAAWGFPGNNGLSTQTGGTATATAGNITGFSDFAIGIAANTVSSTLPVILTSFTAQRAGKEVQLYWNTSSEIDNKKFIVERSPDATHFQAIGEVAGAGTTALSMYYRFTDHLPLTGKNFYRLRQIDIDDRENISSIRLVNFNEDQQAEQIIAYPNPVTTSFSIKGNTQRITALYLSDMSGKRILSLVNPSPGIQLPGGMANGQYLVEAIYENGKTAIFKIVVSR
jgi:hypothetical protein